MLEESVESEVRRRIVGRFESSEEAVFVVSAVEVVAAGVAAVSSAVASGVSLESERRFKTGRSGSSDSVVLAVVVAGLAGVESALAVVSVLSESVRRRIVGREESAEVVEAGGVLVLVVAPESSELPESVRRRIVGREESSAEAVVVPLSVLFPSFGRLPPLATTCGSGPLFLAV